MKTEINLSGIKGPPDFTNLNFLIPKFLELSKVTARKYMHGVDSTNPMFRSLITDLKIDIKDDNSLVTNIDREIDRLVIELWKKYHPTGGILSEESGLVPCTNEYEEYYLILDPFDGTLLPTRGDIGQSGGIYCVIRKVKQTCKWEVLISGVCDLVNIKRDAIVPYGQVTYPPEILANQIPKNMNANNPLHQHKCLFRTDIVHYKNNLIYELSQPNLLSAKGKDITLKGLFLGANVFGGGISASFVKLFGGTLGAIVLPAREDGMSPWDWQAIYHICINFDYLLFEILGDRSPSWKEKKFEEIFIEHKTEVSLDYTPFPHPVIIFHKNRLEEIRGWFEWRCTGKEYSLIDPDWIQEIADTNRQQSPK